MLESPDRVIAGRYRLRAVLGRGGMGTVWRADDELLGREVAVKEVLLPTGSDATTSVDLHRRLLREARAAAQLDHPAIVGVHDVIEDAGRPCIIMQLVRGPSLAEAIEERGSLSPREVARIGLDLLDALRTAHAHGVLHRDVTPRNVLLGADGRVILTDFGIAAVAGVTQFTKTGLLIGTPGYIAPERLHGHAPGPMSDIWSLGATLYTAVEGRPPYEAEEIPALVGAVLTSEPIPPGHAGPLTPILLGLLAKEPSRRRGGPVSQRPEREKCW
jgi:serine/threonine protein kinase